MIASQGDLTSELARAKGEQRINAVRGLPWFETCFCFCFLFFFPVCFIKPLIILIKSIVYLLKSIKQVQGLFLCRWAFTLYSLLNTFIFQGEGEAIGALRKRMSGLESEIETVCTFLKTSLIFIKVKNSKRMGDIISFCFLIYSRYPGMDN